MLGQCTVFERRRKRSYPHPKDTALIQEIQDFLHLPVHSLHSSLRFETGLPLNEAQERKIAQELLGDPLLDEVTLGANTVPENAWTIEIAYKPGVTDNLANTTRESLGDFLGCAVETDALHLSEIYLVEGDLDHEDVYLIASEVLANPLIQNIHICEPSKRRQCTQIDLELSDEGLEELSRRRQLALNLEEMRCIRDYLRREDVKERRAQFGLTAEVSDVELEALAQTWSEHCKHKIFAASIRVKGIDGLEHVNSLFKTYIQEATTQVQKERDWLVSVFSDNAGIIRFTKTQHVCCKVETHNSPSALDPYGGALTGILGVNRDIMGTGKGARLLANSDVFCFAEPDFDEELPPRLMHPRRIMEGVRRGVEHGGNKSGVPTVNGSLVFDKRFLGKPLVYCGSVGIMPTEAAGRPIEEKTIIPGDIIVIAGGRTGRDGIHGATFSSEELHEGSPVSAVQIGDPFTQKKVHDFLLEARDANLYRTLTDNGAGGFSSSIGELAELSGGCEIHLDRAPLKCQDIAAWEILLSESQERMTLAVPAQNLAALHEIAQLHEVELSSLGSFTDTGLFHCLYEGQSVALLDMDFLHNGVPQLQLEADWTPPPQTRAQVIESSYGERLKSLLSRLNVCSKESIVRQYDHEVQGGTVIKPFCGHKEQGPSDAAVLWPVECRDAEEMDYSGLVLSHGICPRYSDLDAGKMADAALDEAIRNCVAVGADPAHIAVLDNFSWPDPVFHAEKNPDGPYKLAQLVKACKQLHDSAIALGTPFISGKDSMKNDYRIAGRKISVPPTLLVTALGRISDIRQAVSMDVKDAGHTVYVLGDTHAELGASELMADLGRPLEGICPGYDPERARRCYEALHTCMQEGWIASCHDCSDGGLAVALAESAFAGGFGMHLDLRCLQKKGLSGTETLFSESLGRLVFTAAPEACASIENRLQGLPLFRLGQSIEENELRIELEGETHAVCETLSDLKTAWQRRL